MRLLLFISLDLLAALRIECYSLSLFLSLH